MRLKDNKVYVTKEWLQKLEAELKDLKENRRVEIAEKLKEAISFWDLSENAEYDDARTEQAQIEKRIRDLEEQLKNVEIIKEVSKKEDTVRIWATVTITNVAKSETIDYKIVWTTESDILANPPRISNESPIGHSIIWKKKWSVIKVKAPGWVIEYKIEEIK